MFERPKPTRQEIEIKSEALRYHSTIVGSLGGLDNNESVAFTDMDGNTYFAIFRENLIKQTTTLRIENDTHNFARALIVYNEDKGLSIKVINTLNGKVQPLESQKETLGQASEMIREFLNVLPKPLKR